MPMHAMVLFNMDRGLYVAAGGMLAELDRQNALSNNLANLATPGYKPDWTLQREYGNLPWNNRLNGSAIGVWGIGPETSYQPNMAQAGFTQTQNQYDLALDGQGFFQVRTPQGIRYTRNGSFTVNGRGQLTTGQGYLVLGQNGAPLTVGGGQKLLIRENGQVVRDGITIGTIGIVNLNNPQKIDASLWGGTAAGRPATTIVHQNAVEDSGTDAIKTITDITVSQRAFDAGQRVLRAIDDSLAIAAKIAQVN